jgi:hypothetical protein
MRFTTGLAGQLLLLGVTYVPPEREFAVGDDPFGEPLSVPRNKPLDCTIRSQRTCVLGKVPKITVTITNRSKAHIYLVGSLDASDRKWRYPHCYFKVTGPDGKSAVQECGRCGNMNNLREKDFVKVPPGKAFEPYQKMDEQGFFSSIQLDETTFRKAGDYRIRFFYSTKNHAIAKWMGDAKDEKIVGMFKRVPKVEIRSNEIKVTIVKRTP